MPLTLKRLLCLVCLGLALTTHAKAMTPIGPMSIEQAAKDGVCLLSECAEHVRLERRISQEALNQLRRSGKPWAMAMALLCEADACSPPRAPPKPLLPLSFAKLKSALTSPVPHVRAMALLRLDLDSPGARKMAEAMLHDGAWLSPLPITVADHAFQRLQPGFAADINAMAPRPSASLPAPGWSPALNTYKGLPGVAGLRGPDANASAEWRAELKVYKFGYERQEANRRTLAGLWQHASRAELERALAHAEREVRLIAFDALLVRKLHEKPTELARQLLARGGVVNSDSCIPVPQSSAVALFLALERSPHPRAAVDFVSTLPVHRLASGESPMAVGFGPRHEISELLASSPWRLSAHATSLRRWADEELVAMESHRKAIEAAELKQAWKLGLGPNFEGGRALSMLNEAQDLPRLLRLARLGEFWALGTRAETPLLEQASLFQRSECWSGGTHCKHYRSSARSAWYRYVLGLPAPSALPLLEALLAAKPQGTERQDVISQLLALSHAAMDPDIAIALWQRHAILLPTHANAALVRPVEPTAFARLRDTAWLAPYGRAEAQGKPYCSGYAGVVKQLFVKLSPDQRLTALEHAFAYEPACALADYARAFLAAGRAGLEDYSFPDGSKLPDTVRALLAERIRQANGDEWQRLEEVRHRLFGGQSAKQT